MVVAESPARATGRVSVLIEARRLDARLDCVFCDEATDRNGERFEFVDGTDARLEPGDGSDGRVWSSHSLSELKEICSVRRAMSTWPCWSCARRAWISFLYSLRSLSCRERAATNFRACMAAPANAQTRFERDDRAPQCM